MKAISRTYLSLFLASISWLAHGKKTDIRRPAEESAEKFLFERIIGDPDGIDTCIVYAERVFRCHPGFAGNIVRRFCIESPIKVMPETVKELGQLFSFRSKEDFLPVASPALKERFGKDTRSKDYRYGLIFGSNAGTIASNWAISKKGFVKTQLSINDEDLGRLLNHIDMLCR